MRRFVTSDDLQALLRAGETELVLEEGDQMTDLARETARRRGIQVLTREEARRRGQEQAQRQPAPPPEPRVEYIVKEVPVYRDRPAAPAKAPEPPFDLVIKNGVAVLPEMGCVRMNVCIRGGKIAALTTREPGGRQVIDAEGLHILPGIIDPHTHMGLYAPLEEELESESRSAILGGVTTIGTFFNFTGSYLPVMDRVERAVAERSRVDMIPHYTLREELQLDELGQYAARGMNSFKVYMCGVPGLFPHQEDGFIVRAMQRLGQLPTRPVLCVHAENTSIVDFATEELKDLTTETLEQWAQSHPNLAEGEAVIRSAYFSQKLGVRTYIVHASCKESMEALRRIKHDKLFVETTSPYLTLDTASDIGVLGKMLPPFREPASRQALWDGIRSGIINTIGTDNVTMTLAEKKALDGMEGAEPGYPALGTHLVCVLSEGLFRQEVPLEKLTALMTMNPAKIFGVYPQKGTIMPGSDADLVLVDLNSVKTVQPQKLMSRSDFSLFQGRQLRGWPCATIKGGHIVAWQGELVDDVYRGQVLRHGKT